MEAVKMLMRVFVFVFWCSYLVVLRAERFCVTTNGQHKCDDESNIRLTRMKGKQIGEEEEIMLDDGRSLFAKTVSHKPLILEIPQFLTEEECTHFINTAKEEGLKSSQTQQTSTGENRFRLLDINQDSKLSLEEMRLTIESSTDTYLDEEDILQMYTDVNLDTNGDSYISPDELESFSPGDLQNYLANFLKSHPEKHSRYSKQVWLYPDSSTDKVFADIQDRVAKVASLPIELIKMSDFQVVTYPVKGHYNAHYDSSKIQKEIPCCTRQKTDNCRICRYMTVLFYLSDVEEGGETAFPVAGNDTVSLEKAQLNRINNLYRKCNDSMLRVPPEAGKAILWYNHFIHPETGWMGEMDQYTFHGGCPVIKGSKWIANFWIKTTDDKLEDLQRMKKFSEKVTVKNVKEEL